MSYADYNGVSIHLALFSGLSLESCSVRFLFRFFSVVPPANLDPGSQRDKPNKVRVPAVAQREKDRKQGP